MKVKYLYYLLIASLLLSTGCRRVDETKRSDTPIIPVPDPDPDPEPDPKPDDNSIGGTSGSIMWSYSPDTWTITISGKGRMNDYASKQQPWHSCFGQLATVIINEGITYVGNHAFDGANGVAEISLPSTLTEIGEYAFGVTGITTIDLPSSLKKIGNSAFTGLPYLNTIAIPASVEEIDESAFFGCKVLQSVQFSKNGNLRTIGRCAFAFTKLTSVEFPDNLQTIGPSAFLSDVLSKIVLNKNIRSIGEAAFTTFVPNGQLYMHSTSPSSISLPSDDVVNYITDDSNDPFRWTLYVPRNCKSVYTGLPWSRFYAIYEDSSLGYGDNNEQTNNNNEDPYNNNDNPYNNSDNPYNNGNTEQTAIDGMLPGIFSVSSSTKVHFSQGNLQYQASTNTWRFAENQYDIIGYNGKRGIDLFGWGTGNQPLKTSNDHRDYSTFVDWGVNKISNGGNTANTWRTLTKEEWVYLFHGRENAEKLFGLGSVNGVNGTIILPDNWTTPTGVIFVASTAKGLTWEDTNKVYVNDNNDNFYHNTYSATDWLKMEAAGAVFLPAAGHLWCGAENYVGFQGVYWSSTPLDKQYAANMGFGWGSLNGGQGRSYIAFGQSVRLVR